MGYSWRFRTWFSYFSVWTLRNNERTNTYTLKLEILHRLDIYISTEYGNWLWCPCFFTLELLPPNYIRKLRFKDNLSATIPYGRMMWHLKHASSDHIKRAIDIFDWEPALNNLAANDPVSVFNETIMNMATNFIPNETINCRSTFDKMNTIEPPWMNSFIKDVIRAKDNFYKKFVRKSNNMYLFCAFKNLTKLFKSAYAGCKTVICQQNC